MPHRLDPLLRPESIAVLGASERSASVGRRTLENLIDGGFDGPLYPVNPGRESVLGRRCYARLAELPETVEHVIFAIGDTLVEAALDEVIAHGARAATIMSSLVLEDDAEPDLLTRVTTRAKDAGLLLCGGNGMGFYNFRDGIWACGFETRGHRRDGCVTLISHSGSGMAGIVDVDERIDFNLVVSSGQELTVAMDDYLDFALDMPETRVIGLFMETIRNPEGMRGALAKANERGIPVVALKVGRSGLAARLAVSHSGAIAGRDAAYEALFERYGVQRVDDMDELATALIMFSQPHPVAAGGVVALHDSGGERQLLIDLADALGVPLATITDETAEQLTLLLDPGLPPVNPLDAWGAGGPGADRIMADCMAALMADPGAAIGAVVHDRAPRGRICAEYGEYLRSGHAASGKPVFLVANRQGTGEDPFVVALTRDGFPVVDGLRSFLVGARCLLRYRDFRGRAAAAPLPADGEVVRRWAGRLRSVAQLDEIEAGELLGDFGIPVNRATPIGSETELGALAKQFDYPVALKSAAPGLVHKTDAGGVRLGIRDCDELAAAYREMAARLGPQALVAPMVREDGVEMFLGMVRDEQLGPLVIVGFGGVHAELLNDAAYAMPPFDAATARRFVDGLRLRPLLDGRRGAPRVAIDAFCETAAGFSLLAAELGNLIAEIDVNPLIVHADGCVAVDASVIVRTEPVHEPERQTA